MATEIWATGSNAFGQLKSETIELAGNHAPTTEMEDYTVFRKILSCEDVEAIYTGEYGVHGISISDFFTSIPAILNKFSSSSRWLPTFHLALRLWLST